MPIRRILVPTDFAESSLQALEYAADFAKTTRAKISIVFVLEPIQFASPGDLYAPSANLGMLLEEQHQAAQDALGKLQRDLKKRRIIAATILKEGLAYDEIITAAKETRADLIIMATHGRTGVSHLFLGSVAEKIIRHSPCPVLTVRTPAQPAKKRGAGRKKKTD